MVETVDVLLSQTDVRLGLVDRVKKRILLGWGSDLDGAHVNEVTVAGLATLPICEFLLLARENGAVAERYGPVLQDYLAVVEEVRSVLRVEAEE